ncbi:MAG: GrpB family protein [Saprospiraceae bacterium]|nr:GrpB family protein [Candidatus Opimibacter iunctus]
MVNEKKLEELTPEELGKLFPIQIVPYDKNWVNIFNSESKLIKDTLGDNIALKIEHFGSTAVDGISAKPTIDILIEIPFLTDNLKEMIIQKMTEIDYHFIWRTDERLPYMHFVKGYTIDGFKGDVFHIHMGDKSHPLWDRIYFRDYLRQNKKVAEEYELLKISLAEKFKYDREAYTNAKSEFVKRITEIAKNETGSC